MTRTLLTVIALVATSVAVARGDSLADAQRAIDEVRFDDARRLLAEALDSGTNDPARVRKIYELSGTTAIVRGDKALGEQFYRRWLTLDTTGQLPAGSPPKLTEVFIAAKAYVEAHGTLVVRATRGTAIAVVVENDPMAMAVAVAPLDALANRVTLDAERRATIATTTSAIAIVDGRGNQLAVIQPAASEPGTRVVGVGGRDTSISSSGSQFARPVERREPGWPSRWYTWGIPSGALLAASAIVGIVAIDGLSTVSRDLSRGDAFFSDIDARQRTASRLGTISVTLGSVGIALGVPAVILFVKQRRVAIKPMTNGVAVSMRW